MPIPFSSIPEHIQILIAQKQDLYDFPFFQVCSRKSFAITGKVKTKFTFTTGLLNELYIKFGSTRYGSVSPSSFADFPVRMYLEWVNVDDQVTDRICENLKSLYSTTWSSSYIVNVTRCDRIDCTPENWNDLIECTKGDRYIFNCSMPLELARVPAVKEIYEHLYIESPLDDSDLVSLKMSSIYVEGSNFSSSGINMMLKEWLNGDRDIEKVYITTPQELQKTSVLDEIPYSVDPENTNLDVCTRGTQKLFIEIKTELGLNCIEMTLEGYEMPDLDL